VALSIWFHLGAENVVSRLEGPDDIDEFDDYWKNSL
jgi:hypothetical protein